MFAIFAETLHRTERQTKIKKRREKENSAYCFIAIHQVGFVKNHRLICKQNIQASTRRKRKVNLLFRRCKRTIFIENQHGKLTEIWERHVVASCYCYRWWNWDSPSLNQVDEESKARISMGPSPTTEVGRQRFEWKTMFVIFFMTKGPLLSHEITSKPRMNAFQIVRRMFIPAVKEVTQKASHIDDSRNWTPSWQCSTACERSRFGLSSNE